MSSIRRSDPEYQQAMREAKELFDAAMAKSSTKGRVGRPKAAAAAPAAPTEADEVDDLAEISELEEIVEGEAAALEHADAEVDLDAEPAEPAEPAADETSAPRGRGTGKPRRRTTDA